MSRDFKKERDEILASLGNWEERQRYLYHNYASQVAQGKEGLRDPLTGKPFGPFPEVTALWKKGGGKPSSEWIQRRDEWVEAWIAESNKALECVDSAECLEAVRTFSLALGVHGSKHWP